MNPEIFALIVPLLAAAVQSGTPVLFATLGEMITERSGTLNLGVEGMMLVGAFAAFLTCLLTGSAWLGFLAGGLAAALFSCLHGLVTIVFLGNQVVSGLALTIMGVGLADTLGTPYIGKKVEGFLKYPLPGLSEIPVLGPILFSQDALVYCSYLLVPLVWFLFARTRLGTALDAAGEYPPAAKAAGLSVAKLRWAGLVMGAFLVGLGGAYLSLAYTHLWTTNLTAGRGWIAVALVIFAFWRPRGAVLGAYLFGGVMAFQLRVQALGTNLPSSLLLMLPYGLTILALVVANLRGARSGAPGALGVNVEPEE